ncbi:MOSC domain-containing protein [Noviherbaspirillum autotrophicum]|uniref:Sulfurase n=1 Tax=Noviherbaspirillum autotrophicum TaxID=709839 RepID=A0A0C1YQC3_9BURK|nr:MOSC domain-containing protein [Noviherbaspirillum autotrophicum]KIF82812.1 sulfurase [Noviherbaspirillum autotrophicum]
MRVVSVNLAAVGEMFIRQSERDHRIMTAIHKQPVADAVRVKRLGLAGDEQADLTVHGGLDKAVYAYPSEHYAFWAAQRLAALKREVPLPPGSMGENLTLAGLLERDVWVGDRLHVGSAVLQVTEPRRPCYKFAAKMGFSHAVKMMTQSGFTGFYLRVIEEGEIATGDAVTLLPGTRNVSIAQVNEQRLKGRQRDLF